MSYEVVIHVLKPYTTDDIIAETKEEIMRRTQPLNKTPIEYADLLWTKKLRFNRVYDEYIVRSNFFESLKYSNSIIMR